MKKAIRSIEKILIWVTIILFIPGILLQILSLINTCFLDHRFGEWLPLSASLLNNIVACSFTTVFLIFILEGRERNKKADEFKAVRRIQENFKRALQSLALDAKDQLSICHKDGVVLDELVLDYENDYSAYLSHFKGKLNGEKEKILKLIDQKLTNMSRSGIDYSEDLWEEQAIYDNPHWQEVRKLAKEALKLFNWPLEIPLKISESENK